MHHYYAKVGEVKAINKGSPNHLNGLVRCERIREFGKHYLRENSCEGIVRLFSNWVLGLIREYFL